MCFTMNPHKNTQPKLGVKLLNINVFINNIEALYKKYFLIVE